MLEGVGVHAAVAGVEHVIILLRISKEWGGGGADFERFVTTACRDDGVGGCDGGDDVFDNALRHAVCDAGDVEFLCAGRGGAVEPGNVFGVVGVEDGIFALFFPFDDVGPFDAVLGLARDGGECA